MYALLEFKNLEISQRTEFSRIKFNGKDTYDYQHNKLNEHDKINEKNITSFFKGDIEDGLFGTNWELKKVIIPDNVVSIGKHAFLDCRNLKEVIIPISVTNIDEYAFGMCHCLQNIILPDSIERIGKFAFAGCPELETITWRRKAYYRYGKDNKDSFDILFNELKYLGVVPNDIDAGRMFY